MTLSFVEVDLINLVLWGRICVVCELDRVSKNDYYFKTSAFFGDEFMFETSWLSSRK